MMIQTSRLSKSSSQLFQTSSHHLFHNKQCHQKISQQCKTITRASNRLHSPLVCLLVSGQTWKLQSLLFQTRTTSQSFRMKWLRMLRSKWPSMRQCNKHQRLLHLINPLHRLMSNKMNLNLRLTRLQMAMPMRMVKIKSESTSNCAIIGVVKSFVMQSHSDLHPNAQFRLKVS